MAKFTIILATFTAFLLLVDASIYRTATLVIDQENPRHTREACWRQIERQQNLRDCQQYITQESQSRGYRASPDRRPSQLLDRCCEQLDDLSTGCVCEGLETAIDEQRQMGQLQGRDVRSAFQVAENIPSRCGMETRECSFRIPRSWF